MTEKINSISDVVASVKDAVAACSDESYEKISSQFGHFEDSLSRIMTSEDFSNFKAEFSDFIQKFLIIQMF